jgi:hypothetical protein
VHEARVLGLVAIKSSQLAARGTQTERTTADRGGTISQKEKDSKETATN